MSERQMIALLLEALKALHDDCAEYIKINNLNRAFDNQVMQQARAAIAKATGVLLGKTINPHRTGRKHERPQNYG